MVSVPRATPDYLHSLTHSSQEQPPPPPPFRPSPQKDKGLWLILSSAATVTLAHFIHPSIHLSGEYPHTRSFSSSPSSPQQLLPFLLYAYDTPAHGDNGQQRSFVHPLTRSLAGSIRPSSRQGALRYESPLPFLFPLGLGVSVRGAAASSF